VVSSMKIDEIQEPDYEVVKITHVGFVDPYAVEGMLILRADDGKEFHMRAFLEPKKIKSVTVSIFSPSICHEVMGLFVLAHLHFIIKSCQLNF